MVEINKFGVNLSIPYRRLKLRFGRSMIIEILCEDVEVYVPGDNFVELAENIRREDPSQEKFISLRKISDLPRGSFRNLGEYMDETLPPLVSPSMLFIPLVVPSVQLFFTTKIPRFPVFGSPENNLFSLEFLKRKTKLQAVRV